MAKQSYIATSEGQLAVREAIAYHGFTQQQLAVAANLRTRSSVSKLINGKPVEQQIFQRICQCLELDFRAIAGLQLSSTSIKKDHLVPSSTPEFSRVLTESVLSELNNLKEDLQALMGVPSTLATLDARVQLLRWSLLLSQNLSGPQPTQSTTTSLTLPEMDQNPREIPKPMTSLTLPEMDQNPREIPKPMTPLVVPQMGQQVESMSDVNNFDFDGQEFDRETPGLPSGLEQSFQEGLNESNNEQPNQVPDTHLLNPANAASFDSEQPGKSDVSTPPLEKRSASAPQVFNLVKENLQSLWRKNKQIKPSSEC